MCRPLEGEEGRTGTLVTTAPSLYLTPVAVLADELQTMLGGMI